MESAVDPKEKFIRYYFYLYLAVIFLHLAFNLQGSSATLYTYFLIAGLMGVATIALPLRHSLPFMFFFLIFEGQGRILTGYNPFFRIVFDLYLAIIILKNLVKVRILFPKDKLPLLIYTLFIMHFAWWTIEIFNPRGANVFASLATSKFYIFPIVLFLGILSSDLRVESKEFQNYLFWYFIVLFIGIILCGVQMNFGADFMHGISPNYSYLFKKYQAYSGKLFRPWGTTHIPGGYSGILCYVVGFIFMFRSSDDMGVSLSKRKVRIRYVIYIIFILASWYTMLISQVRTLFIQNLMITILCILLRVWGLKAKSKTILALTVGTLISVGVSSLFLNNLTDFSDKFQLANSIVRIEQLDKTGIMSKRASPSTVLDKLSSDMEIPFGWGPGMTTTFLPAFVEAQKKRWDLKRYQFWALDNFYVFALLELGLGGIFIILISFFIPAFIFKYMVKLKGVQEENSLSSMAPALAVGIVVIIANWGAVLLPFNPVSFFYWFYVAIAMKEYNRMVTKYPQFETSANRVEDQALPPAL